MNSKFFLVLCLFILLFNIALGAAELLQAAHLPEPERSRPYRIGVGFGYSFTGYREETVLDINRYLNTFTFIIDANIKKGRFFHSLNFGIFRGENDPIVAYPADLFTFRPDPFRQYFEFYQNKYIFTRVYFEYALGYRLWGNQRFPGYLGGALRADYYGISSLSNIMYLNFSALVSLGLHVSQKWFINQNNTLVFSVTLPIFGYALRPSFVGFLAYPLEHRIISLHNYWAVFGNLKYHYRITPLLSFYSGVAVEFSHIDFPRPRRDVKTRLSAGIAFTF